MAECLSFVFFASNGPAIMTTDRKDPTWISLPSSSSSSSYTKLSSICKLWGAVEVAVGGGGGDEEDAEMGIDREGSCAWDECGGIGSDGVATVVVVVVVAAAADDDDGDGRVGSCFLLFFPKPKNDDEEVLLSIASLVLTTATFGGMYVPFNLYIHGGDTIVNHIAINVLINRSIKQSISIHSFIKQSASIHPINPTVLTMQQSHYPALD